MSRSRRRRIRTSERQPIVDDIPNVGQATRARCRDQAIRQRQRRSAQRKNGRLTGCAVVGERKRADVDGPDVVGVRRPRRTAKHHVVIAYRPKLQSAGPIEVVRPQAVTAATRPRPIRLCRCLIHAGTEQPDSGHQRSQKFSAYETLWCETHSWMLVIRHCGKSLQGAGSLNDPVRTSGGFESAKYEIWIFCGVPEHWV